MKMERIARRNGLLCCYFLFCAKRKTVYAKFSRKRFRKLLKKLSDEGVTIIGEMETYDGWEFAHEKRTKTPTTFFVTVL
jgi:hypothetical protein